jgi:hypothetical protein
VKKLTWCVLALSLVGAAAAAVVLVIGDEGDDTHTLASTGVTAPATPRRASRSSPPASSAEGRRDAIRRQVREAVAESRAARLDSAQRRVARTVGSYVAALDRADGARICELLAPGALSGVRLPRRRGDCERSVAASIGYRDPRGFPVFAGARVARIRAVEIDGAEARVTATTVTRFADRQEPSVEDDVVYLDRQKGRWRIEKPGATFYRAIGVGDIPPQALAPP